MNEVVKKQDLSLANEVIEAVKTLPEKYANMVDLAQKAELELSSINTINDSSDAELANASLVGARNLFKTVQELRKTITKPFDTFKAGLMEVEKRISPDEKNGIYAKAKEKYDAYIKEEQRKAEELRRKAQIEFERANNLIQMEAELKRNIINGIDETIQKGKDLLQGLFNAISHDPNTVNKLVSTHNVLQLVGMKESTFLEFFKIKKVLPHCDFLEDVFDLIKSDEVEYTYEYQNQRLKDELKPFGEELISKSQEQHQKAIELYELSRKNAEEAERQRLANEQKRQEEEKKRKEAEEAERQRKQAEQEAKLKQEAEEKALLASFEQASKVQNIEPIKNTRTTKVAVIEHKNSSDFHSIVLNLVSANLQNPNFKPFKLDENGEPIIKDGIPQYEGWLAEMLTFYAKNSEVLVEGIVLKDVVTVINKK